MAGKKGMRRREKVMYDPLNLSAVSERFFREEKEAKEKAKLEKKATQAKERASKLKLKKQALNKVRENQRKITAEATKKIKTGQKQLDKQAKKLDKATVTGPLGGEIKIKTLKKISGGAPGLDRGIRSKMFIGKKFSDGGSMSKDKPKANAKAYTESSRPFLGIKAGSTDDKKIVYGGRRYTREEALVLQKKMKQSKDPILMDEAVNKLQRRINTHDAMKKEKANKVETGNVLGLKKKSSPRAGVLTGRRAKRTIKGDITKKMNMGGVMKNRGGTFKGVF